MAKKAAKTPKKTPGEIMGEELGNLVLEWHKRGITRAEITDCLQAAIDVLEGRA